MNNRVWKGMHEFALVYVNIIFLNKLGLDYS